LLSHYCSVLTLFINPISAVLLAVTWQILDDTEALRQVDFRTACDIMKTWVAFQDILCRKSSPSFLPANGQHGTGIITTTTTTTSNKSSTSQKQQPSTSSSPTGRRRRRRRHSDEDDHYYQAAIVSMLSLDDLKSLKDHSRRAINAVASAKDKMVAIGMLIHATYHLTIISEMNNEEIVFPKEKEEEEVVDEKNGQQQRHRNSTNRRSIQSILRTAKLCAQQVYRQYIQDFGALHMAAQHELYPNVRGIFADKAQRRSLLLQFASLTHMVYLLPPTTTTTTTTTTIKTTTTINSSHHHEESLPRFPNLEQAAMKIMTKLRSVGFASRLVAYPIDPYPPCYGTFQGHASTVFDCQIFDDPGNIKCVSASNDGTVRDIYIYVYTYRSMGWMRIGNRTIGFGLCFGSFSHSLAHTHMIWLFLHVFNKLL
jgi:hypothetical protein